MGQKITGLASADYVDELSGLEGHKGLLVLTTVPALKWVERGTNRNTSGDLWRKC